MSIDIEKYISFLGESDILKVLKVEPKAIRYVDDPSYKAQKMALLHGRPSILKYIKKPDPRIWRMAIDMDASVIQLHPNPPLSLQMQALRINYAVILFIDNPCKEAVAYAEARKQF